MKYVLSSEVGPTVRQDIVSSPSSGFYLQNAPSERKKSLRCTERITHSAIARAAAYAAASGIGLVLCAPELRDYVLCYRVYNLNAIISPSHLR